MKKLPFGIQSFRKVIEGGYVYVDKTQYVYDLLCGESYYFLSRPRRFGKSLLLDTIAEAFSGDKGLFKGLHLYDSGYEFLKHPVIRFDMSNMSNDTPEILMGELVNELKKHAREEGLDIGFTTPSAAFKTLIEELYRKHNKTVVVLIDEYDKPILDHISDIELAEANRKALRGFYGVLKSMDPFLRLTFITGITKFTKTSVFSGLNNLRDLTLSRKYANICGIPTDELGQYFSEHIGHLKTLEGFNRYDSVYDEILSWYDGYSWDGRTRVINPFSLLGFLTEERFANFWYASGTPKFLLDLIKQRPNGYTNLKNFEMGEWTLDTFDIHKLEIEPLLFQTGYLTVKEVLPDQAPAVYLLDMPNNEVRLAFNLHILAEFTESGAAFSETAYRRIKENLRTGDLVSMMETLKALFSSIPYQLHIKHEHYYHSIFFAILNLLGFDIDPEVSVSGGRIDAVLENHDKVYIMEFKYFKCEPDASPEEKRKLFDKSLEEGMQQIIDRGYCAKYAGSGKNIYQVALVFLGRDDIDIRVEMV